MHRVRGERGRVPADDKVDTARRRGWHVPPLRYRVNARLLTWARNLRILLLWRVAERSPALWRAARRDYARFRRRMLPVLVPFVAPRVMEMMSEFLRKVCRIVARSE